MSQHKVKIGAVQSQCSADLEANLAAAERGIRKATAAGAQIICLQELFRSLYFCQVEDHKYFELAEPVPGPTTDKMQELAKELGVVIVPSLFERRAPGIYHNTAAVIDADGTYLGKYRKMHIPDDPLYYEKFYFTPGDLGFSAWDTKFARIGVCVCWDQWYPKRHGSRRCVVRKFFSIPPPSGGIRAKRRSMGGASIRRGRPCSAATPSPMAAMWPFLTASAMKRQREVQGLNFGAKVLSAILRERSSRKAPVMKKTSSSRKPILRASRPSGSTGRFCGTGELMPTQKLHGASLTRRANSLYARPPASPRPRT